MVDTVAPSVPTVLVDSPTNDNTPTFTGTADVDATITLLSGGVALGQAAVDASGNYSYTPTATVTDGTHAITATAADNAGNTSAESSSVTLVVDTAAPAAQL